MSHTNHYYPSHSLSKSVVMNFTYGVVFFSFTFRPNDGKFIQGVYGMQRIHRIVDRTYIHYMQLFDCFHSLLIIAEGKKTTSVRMYHHM